MPRNATIRGDVDVIFITSVAARIRWYPHSLSLIWWSSGIGDMQALMSPTTLPYPERGLYIRRASWVIQGQNVVIPPKEKTIGVCVTIFWRRQNRTHYLIGAADDKATSNYTVWLCWVITKPGFSEHSQGKFINWHRTPSWNDSWAISYYIYIVLILPLTFSLLHLDSLFKFIWTFFHFLYYFSSPLYVLRWAYRC